MSGPPGHREFSTAEMAFATKNTADGALRRVAGLEARLASAEARLAEKDQLVMELRDAFAKQAEATSAMSVIVRELQEKLDRGVDQVLTGLDTRLALVERQMAFSADAQGALSTLVGNMNERYQRFFDVLLDDTPPLSQLQRKPGRPKGSKNKPKLQPAAEGNVAEDAGYAPSDIPKVE